MVGHNRACMVGHLQPQALGFSCVVFLPIGRVAARHRVEAAARHQGCPDGARKLRHLAAARPGVIDSAHGAEARRAPASQMIPEALCLLFAYTLTCYSPIH